MGLRRPGIRVKDFCIPVTRPRAVRFSDQIVQRVTIQKLSAGLQPVHGGGMLSSDKAHEA